MAKPKRKQPQRFCETQRACEEGTTLGPNTEGNSCPKCVDAIAKRGKVIEPRGLGVKFTKQEGRIQQ